MSEPDGAGSGGGGNPSHKQIGRELMDLDLDLDSSWPLDPNPFPSNPSSPFFLSFPAHSSNSNPILPLSSSEHPSSPLWAFSDDADEISPDASISAFSGGFRLADCSRFMSCNSDLTHGNPAEGSDKRSLVPASVGTPEEEEISDESCIIKERMTQALRYFKDSAEQHFLVQVWAPVRNGNHCVLTTSGQPFLLDPHSNRLLQYRTVSLMYLFSVDGESDGDLGLPGRVFRQKLPEWTPNVQYYSSKEYPRRNHALHYNVRGTLALPVFEPSGQSCVGVVELIMTSQKINYSSEVDKVCKALEAVNLKSSDILDHPNRQICNKGRQAALAEILEILTVVCETHKLPLAQTWVPCKHRSILAYGGGSKKSCTSFDGSCMGQVCMSTTDVAYYLVDAHMWGFRDACAEHHLQKGQGVAGRAFLLHQPCFSTDITKFSKTEYPLVHYARMFGLLSCLAICLRSSYTGSDDYILEFFLPSTCVDPKEQKILMESLLKTTSRCFRSLKVFSCNELLEEGGSLEVVEINSSKIESDQINYQTSPNRKTSPGIDDVGFDGLGNRENINQTLLEGQLVTEVDCQKNENKILIDVDGCQSTSSVFDNKSMKTCERRRGKTEKSISLEVIQQYFTGSLKDAAKSLGVCPTTMKRICRQHGISRWPSRKINKVNRSLSKLKRVIESVQGAEGAFNLVSLTSPLPVAVGSISWPLKSEGARQNLTEPKTSDLQAEKKIEYPIQKTEGSVTEGRLLVQSSFQGELVKELFGSKTRSVSGEGSTGTPPSEDSCQGSPPDESHTNNLPVISSFQEQCLIMDRSFVPEPIEGPNLVAAYSTPDALLTTEPQNLLGGMLIEDSGSCKDLIDLCNFAANGCQDDASRSEPPNLQAMPTFALTMPHITATQDMRTITIKATYKEDIIRFRISLASSVFELKEEVSKRLKLEAGTFDIKYLDDDNEWVLLVCDADLQECVELTKSSGRHMIRLLVHDILANFGSSCESSGD